MLGQKRLTLNSAAACSRDSATTGPTGTQSKDFAANLRLVAGDQQTGPLGSALTQPIQVRVVDAGGQPVQGATVTFSVRAGGGAVNPAANVSDGNGLVSATWTMGTTLGAAKVVAILTNAFVLDSTVFTATATAGPATKFAKVSGDSQTAVASRQLAAPVVVKVQDAFGNNISGIKVTWTPGAFSGSVSFVADTTAADGTASATWRLGTAAIVQSLSASVTGVGTPIGFTATATADTGRTLTIVTGNNQTGNVSAALATQLQVRVTDQHGNVIAGAGVTWNDSLVGGGTGSALAAQTSALGTSSITWTLGNRAGAQLLRAKLTGRTETATFNATANVAFWEVFAGNSQACAIAASNSQAYCWGAGDGGQLGKGVNKNISAPTTPVATAADSVAGPFLSIRQLTGGRNSFCALTVARQIYCWGRVIGQASQNSNTATLVNLVDPRQQILPLMIAAGEEHLCVLDLAGFGFCTGTNFSGQLGDGTYVSPNVGTYPFIAPALTDHYSSIVAGRQHTCGFRQNDPPTLLAANLVPVCWGLNTTGQVGNATVTTAGVNTRVVINILGAAPTTAFDTTSLSLGASHTCALSAAPTAGLAYCWGSNGFGQLGRGTVLSATARDSVARPVSMPAGVTFTRIYAGEYHSCAISTSGIAYCWGRNDFGQLGDGTRTTATAPVGVAGGLSFRSLSLGEFFTCGVTGAAALPGTPSQTAGTVYCWGDNLFGQIGQNTTGNNTPYLTPTRVLYQP
jgi:alpha-tubulin suppressor-like RCC1 family protein